MKFAALILAIFASIGVAVFPAMAGSDAVSTRVPEVDSAQPAELAPSIAAAQRSLEFEPDAPAAADVIVGPIDPVEPEFEPDAPPAADVIVGPDPVEPVVEDFDANGVYYEIPSFYVGRARLFNSTMQIRGQINCSHDVQIRAEVTTLTNGTDGAKKGRVVKCNEGQARFSMTISDIEMAQPNGQGPHQYIVRVGLSNIERPDLASVANTDYIVRANRAQFHDHLQADGWAYLIHDISGF